MDDKIHIECYNTHVSRRKQYPLPANKLERMFSNMKKMISVILCLLCCISIAATPVKAQAATASGCTTVSCKLKELLTSALTDRLKALLPTQNAGNNKPDTNTGSNNTGNNKPNTNTGNNNTGNTNNSASAASSEAKQMLNLVNSERRANGLAELKWNDALAKVAQEKALDMQRNNYFSHTSPTYGSPFDMMKSFGISYRFAAENIAKNGSVEKAHVALMNSDGHRKNILNANYTAMGIGIVKTSSGYIIVQMFIG